MRYAAAMTDLTPAINQLLREKHGAASLIPDYSHTATPAARTDKTVNEFLKEAYRINSHIHSLLSYLQSIRHSYLSHGTSSAVNRSSLSSSLQRRRIASPSSIPAQSQQQQQQQQNKHLTDPERDSIDSSTALLLRDLSSSINNLSSAETLRQETETSLLRKKYGHPNNIIWRWAAGGGGGGGGGNLSQNDENERSKPEEQRRDEEIARTIRSVRESVLWFLRRGLEEAAEVQRGMVEKRIERVREREKSVLYKSQASSTAAAAATAAAVTFPSEGRGKDSGYYGGAVAVAAGRVMHDTASTMTAGEAADIESQLSPEQLQLFAEENNIMLKHYEDTLSKVQNAEKSLLEISSLQRTLVSHLSTQEEYINQLVTDAMTTSENIGRGNKQLKRATERRSTAQMVFWGTVGLCTWLVVWDAIF